MTVFVGIKGAFDNIEHAANLREITKPVLCERLYAGVSNFLQDRSISMSGNEGDSPHHVLHRGILQSAVQITILLNISLWSISSDVREIV